MGENTKIEWCDFTFNGVIGCHKVSPACKHCYAEVETFPRVQRGKGIELWGADAERHITSDDNWRKPLAWNRAAEKAGVRRRVFAYSLADVFERREGDVGAKLDAARARLWKLIEATPWLDWLLLTKRPENIRTMVPGPWLLRFPRNIWLGTTCENQEEAEKRIPELLGFDRAVVHFVSAEPLLGPIDFTSLRGEPCDQCGSALLYNAFTADVRCETCDAHEMVCWARINWVIPGGESGDRARFTEIDWIKAIIKQCDDYEVACFVKQLGARTVWTHDTVELRRGKYEPPPVLKHKKGGNADEWPEPLRVRQFPGVRA